MHAERMMIATSAMTVVLCALVWAGGGPGFNWGGQNCGCITNESQTHAGCIGCCNGVPPPMDPQECRDFCDQAVFPCESPGCHWWTLWIC